MNNRFDDGSLITLDEAMQKWRASELESDMTDKIPVEMTQLFEQHDAIHILFNCGTSLEDEIAVHIWMLFATTAKISEMHRAVANFEHRRVLSGIGHLKLVGVWITCLPRIASIIFKSLRMKKRLAIAELSTLKEQPIIKIRREHGIILEKKSC